MCIKGIINEKVEVMVKIHMMKAYEGDFIWLSYGDMEKEYHQKWFHVKVLLPMIPVFAVGGIIISFLMVWSW